MEEIQHLEHVKLVEHIEVVEQAEQALLNGPCRTYKTNHKTYNI